MMSELKETDKKVPGGVYLCQISPHISCGACCGLYNVADASEATLKSMLTYRTRTFAHVPRNMDAILAFKQEIEARENQDRPFPQFHHCPYIGIIDNYRRVGCLLHPLAEGNNGVDFRGLSFYGGMACNMYFCPTHHHMPAVYKEIVRELAEDWYTYGLIITEITLLEEFFKTMEIVLRRPMTKSDIMNDKSCKQVIREFLRLKPHWQFRGADDAVGNYFFDDQLYPRPPINYDAIGACPSKYHVLFYEMGSRFESSDALHEAEKLLDALFICLQVRFQVKG